MNVTTPLLIGLGLAACGCAVDRVASGPSDAAQEDAGRSECVGAVPVCCDPGSATLDCNDPAVGPAECVQGAWVCLRGGAPSDVCTGICADTDGGADAGPGCGSQDCAAGEVCVTGITVGGAQIPVTPDGGYCPAGTTLVGSFCGMSPAYACQPWPAACGTALDCMCAASVCTPPSACSTTSPDQVNCVFFAP